ncbi:hypothetical protein DL769_010775 [Monosporascus sp. CRB-8-3]|nr:hypothetical protein DL769_010775 [Monosporascus sp. CRB-8-3]
MKTPHFPAFSPLWVIVSRAIGGVTGFDVLDYVDPLIGTVNGGATLPFGMAKAVADVNTEIQGGFASDDGEITGFSHMHDSGTGGGASLGNFPLFAQTGCAGDELNNCYFPKSLRASKRINETVEARPGYFSLSLNTSVRAEITVSNHTALYRFTFPTDGSVTKRDPETCESCPDPELLPYSPLILADLTDLSDSRGDASIQVYPDTGRIIGNGTFEPSFGIGTYDLHFCTDFQGAKIRNTGVFQNNRAGSEPKTLRTFADKVNKPPLPGGAWVQFHAPESNQILVRVGLSFLNTDQACSNAEKEIPRFDFEATRNDAEDAWREKLSSVDADSSGVDTSLQRLFWSGMYRSLISPQDYTGENPLWNSTEPYFDSYYCIWDSFRSTHPLLTLIDPNVQALMGFTQGGSNADNLLADSYVKGLSDGIDWETAYEAAVSDAEVEPHLWTVEGRGGLNSWKTLGYIPTDDFDPWGVGPMTRSISRTIEYSYNDFCIAEIARGMNKTADAEKYLRRSGNWINMFQEDSRSLLNLTGSPDPEDLVDSGFNGFLQPRYLNGTFGYQDPALCTFLWYEQYLSSSPEYRWSVFAANGHETYEGGAWLYTFYVPHDQATLIPTLGGPDEFVRRLEFMHNTPGLLYIGNEQSYLLVFIFHYAGRPGLSAQYAHKYIPGSFNDTVNGIPGNDDSGAMGSFTTLTMMGVYPMSGQDVYLIIPPFFPEVNITNRITGNTATLRNLNFDPSYRNIYIQSATLNGAPYTKSWLTHGFFLDGGVLELTLGPHESDWGVNEEDYPPSASTHF